MIAIVVVDVVVIAVLVDFLSPSPRQSIVSIIINITIIYPHLSHLRRRDIQRRHRVSLRNVCECRISASCHANVSLLQYFMYTYIIYIYHIIILPDRWELIKNKKRGEKRDRQLYSTS